MPWSSIEEQRAYRAKHRDEINAKRRASRGYVDRECTCEVCGRVFKTSRKVVHTCGAKECQREQQRRHMREHYAKFGKRRNPLPSYVHSCAGLTKDAALAVMAAQDCGDAAALFAAAQKWTPAQRKFARKRYEQRYGLFGSGRGLV